MDIRSPEANKIISELRTKVRSVIDELDNTQFNRDPERYCPGKYGILLSRWDKLPTLNFIKYRTPESIERDPFHNCTFIEQARVAYERIASILGYGNVRFVYGEYVRSDRCCYAAVVTFRLAKGVWMYYNPQEKGIHPFPKSKYGLNYCFAGLPMIFINKHVEINKINELGESCTMQDLVNICHRTPVNVQAKLF
jgi:hypothetical protein